MYGYTITLFNFHAATGLWHTAVFQNADAIELRSDHATQHGTAGSDTVAVIIHTQADKAAMTAQGLKQYIGPKAYAKLPDPGGYFTFTPETDFMAVGDLGASEPLADDDYEEGLYHAMNDEQDGVYMVTSAAFYPLLPHFEIGGR